MKTLMRITVIFVFVAVVLIGGAAAWWWGFRQPAEPVVPAVSPAIPAEPAKTEAPVPAISQFGTISGMVISQEGRPLPNVRIAYQMGDAAPSYSSTDPSAAFKVTALSAGEYRFTVYKEAAGSATHELENPTLTLAAGQELKDVKLVAKVLEAGYIRGRVIDLAERPVGGVVLVCAESITQKVTTDDQGAFAFAFREAQGNVDITFRRGNYGERVLQATAIGSDALDVVLERGGTLKGSVQSKGAGAPVRQFRLVLEPKLVSTEEYCLPRYETEISSEDGSFSLDAIAPGRLLVTVLAAEFASAHQEVDIRDGAVAGPLTFELGDDKGGRGRVADAKNGRSLVGVRIYLDKQPEFEYGDGYAAQSDAGGGFSLQGLPEGQVNLWAVAKSGYAPQHFVVDTRHPPVLLKLVPSGKVSGLVLYNGRPLDNAAVTIIQWDENNKAFIRRQRTDRRGYYEFSTLAEGVYTLEAANHLNPDDLMRTKQVTITVGQEVVEDFDF